MFIPIVIICLILSIMGLTMWFLFRLKQKHVAYIDPLFVQISTLFHKGIAIVRQKINSIFIGLFVFFVVHLCLINLNTKYSILFVLVTFLWGAVSAGIISFVLNKFISHFSHYLYDVLKSSSLELSRYVFLRGAFIVTFSIGFTFLSFFMLYSLFSVVLDANVFGALDSIKSIIHEVMLNNPGYDFHSVYILDKGFFGHLLLYYSFGFIGYILSVVVFSSVFGTISDVAVDMTNLMDFNYSQDDIRNPGFFSDQVGDILKKSSSICLVISALVLLICNFTYIFASNDHLLGTLSIKDNHIFAMFLIIVLGVFINFIMTVGLSFRSIKFDKFSCYVSRMQWGGLFAFLVGMVCLEFMGLISLSTIFTVFWGSLVCVVWVPVSFYLLTTLNQSDHSSSIFNLIFFGISKSFKLCIIYGVCFIVGILGVHYTLAYGFDHSLSILEFLYFMCGCVVQMIFILPFYSGLSILDTVQSICLISDKDDDIKERLRSVHLLSVILSMVIKVGIAFMGMACSVGFFKYYFMRLKLFIGFSNSRFLEDPGIVHLNMTDVWALFNVSIDNPLFILGIFIGGGFLIVLIGVLLMGTHRTFIRFREILHEQVNQYYSSSEETSIDYEPSIVFCAKSAQWVTCAMGVVILLLSLGVSFILGVSGVFGVMVSVLPSIYFLDLFFSVLGHVWSYVYVLNGTSGNQMMEDSDYTSRINEALCDSLGDICKNLLGTTITTMMVFMMIVFLVCIPVVIYSEMLRVL